ncbi:NAD(P)-dependent dehydrogenase (short-subunit alcohol dehydrogenase family) [Rhodobium orientis]|uniref:3-oxoacyl-ACP reductase n=1 Tax=Rhodobium orientis TaxID=34017 RepID=A0A327JMN8_9HYPH|nr:SDR family oxidoreductase [Rhodobium orientis]MBB4301372.1 NAD(P)-dependent dehydrogenase (short-subunit alcohol dehydrogenase family) [Rhodobium orientis]MBK5951041.1 3-oxoacyl-ACP reductase [Rhodobium orientis]RAI27597.1 3-oxoacyl-ACP reductase [Rhodobium orientis]
MPEKTIVITGAGSGIGLATAELHAARGWHIAAVDRDAAALERMKERLGDASVSLHAADITDEAAVETLAAECRDSAPPVAALVNSAGIGAAMPITDTTSEMMRRIYEVNVIGAFQLCKALTPLMTEAGGGGIVNIVSVSGIKGNFGRSAYGASKGALITLTKIMAVELAAAGIRVNAVAPGPIETAMSRDHHSESTREEWHRTIPMRRYGTPEEVAEAVLFLADPRTSSYVTGQILSVDGGFVSAGLMV